MIIKKCRHTDAAVKCEYKDWIFLTDRSKAVRRCTYGGICVYLGKGRGAIKNGAGGGGKKLLH